MNEGHTPLADTGAAHILTGTLPHAASRGLAVGGCYEFVLTVCCLPSSRYVFHEGLYYVEAPRVMTSIHHAVELDNAVLCDADWGIVCLKVLIWTYNCVVAVCRVYLLAMFTLGKRWEAGARFNSRKGLVFRKKQLNALLVSYYVWQLKHLMCQGYASKVCLFYFYPFFPTWRALCGGNIQLLYVDNGCLLHMEMKMTKET